MQEHAEGPRSAIILKCVECGAKNEADAHRCTICGSSLEPARRKLAEQAGKADI